MKKSKILLKLVMYFGLFMVFIFSIYSLLNNNDFIGNVSSETGTEVYYDNYGWRDGLYLRDKNSITYISTDTTTYLRNQTFIMTGINNTSVTQNLEYSYTEIKGHEVSAKIGAKIKVYEAEVGYTFTSITEKTMKAILTIAPGKTVTLYKYDNCEQTIKVSNYMTEEVFSWLKWKHYQTWGTYTEYIRKYAGAAFRFVES